VGWRTLSWTPCSRSCSSISSCCGRYLQSLAARSAPAAVPNSLIAPAGDAVPWAAGTGRGRDHINQPMPHIAPGQPPYAPAIAQRGPSLHQAQPGRPLAGGQGPPLSYAAIAARNVRVCESSMCLLRVLARYCIIGCSHDPDIGSAVAMFWCYVALERSTSSNHIPRRSPVECPSRMIVRIVADAMYRQVYLSDWGHVHAVSRWRLGDCIFSVLM